MKDIKLKDLIKIIDEEKIYIDDCQCSIFIEVDIIEHFVKDDIINKRVDSIFWDKNYLRVMLE